MTTTIKSLFLFYLGIAMCFVSYAHNDAKPKDVKASCTLTAGISSTTPVLCNGGSNGSATVTPSGGTTPYTYSWAPVACASATITGLSAGTYTVTVTDAASCTATAMAIITQPPILIASVGNDTVCTGSCTGQLSGSLTGGTWPYTYSWSNGMTTAMITGLCAGSYTFTAMDANGCTATASAMVTSESNIPSLSVIPTVTNATCTGTLDGSISLNVTAPSSPFTYAWQQYPLPTPPIYSGNSFNDLNPGTYTVTISDKYKNCNVFSYSVGTTTTCNYIYGSTFNDTNFSCSYSSKDPELLNSYITITPGSYVIYPNSAGNFSQYLPYGTYTVTQNIYSGSPFAACQSSQTAVVNSSSPTVYFADTTHAPLSDPMIKYFYATPILVGDSCSAQFQVINNGSVASNGKAFFTVGDSLKLISSTPPYSSYSHDTVYWNYSGLAPLGTLNYTVHCTADTTVFTGWYDCSFAGVQPSSPESNSDNDIMAACEFFGVACDPNNKSVNPAGIGPNGYIYNTDSVLTYTIRFQNVGTAVAQNIYIVDTISSKLDINTLMVLGASKTFSYTVTGNRVRFIFNSIYLPDSTTSRDGSKGWIQYQVKQNKANNPGDVIYNTAYIYFDYNSPVITNTTTNTLFVPTGLAEITNEQSLKIYPNPASDEVNLSYTLNKSTTVKITVTDLLGRTVFTKDMGTKQAGKQLDVIPVNSFASGTYILKLQTGNSILNKKLVIIR